MTEEQESEIKRLMKLFHELPSIGIDDAKQCVIRCIKLEIELLESLNREKFIVHWSQEKFNDLVQDKYKLLSEIRKL